MAQHPERHATLGEGAQHPTVERALDERQQLGVRPRDREDVGPRVVGGTQGDVAPGREVLERGARQAPVERRDVGRGQQDRTVVAVQRCLRGTQRGRLEAAARRDLRGPAPRTRGELGAQRLRAVGAQELVEPRVVGRGERADDDGGHGAELVSPRRNASPPARAPP